MWSYFSLKMFDLVIVSEFESFCQKKHLMFWSSWAHFFCHKFCNTLFWFFQCLTQLKSVIVVHSMFSHRDNNRMRATSRSRSTSCGHDVVLCQTIKRRGLKAQLKCTSIHCGMQRAQFHVNTKIGPSGAAEARGDDALALCTLEYLIQNLYGISNLGGLLLSHLYQKNILGGISAEI